MKASNLIKEMQDLMKAHGDKELVYSTDGEGNAFKKVEYNPSAGNWAGRCEGFVTEGTEDADAGRSEINAFCIN